MVKKHDMPIPTELKENIFKVIEEHLPLKNFADWLYSHAELPEQMAEDVVLEAYSFNYGQRRANHEFKVTFLSYFDREEFMLWK